MRCRHPKLNQEAADCHVAISALHKRGKPAKIGAQNTEKGHKMPPIPPPLNRNAPCPCGSQHQLQQCCLIFIEGTLPAPTAETLMRSRYTAHALSTQVLSAIDYLWDTWSPEQRERSSKADIRHWAESCEWLGLEIRRTQAGSAIDEQGLVEFVAHFRQAGQNHQHHELSVFKKAEGKWLYVDHLS
jgi:SEC-C motif-containing protein